MKIVNDEKIFVSAAEKYPNVTLFFNHKLVDANLEKGTLSFMQ